MAPVRSRAGPRWGLLALGVLLSLVVPGTAVAAESPKGLAFVTNGEPPVAVPMAKDYLGEFSGRLNFAIRNDSDLAGRLRLLFIPATSGRALNLGREGDLELVRRIRPPAERLRLRAHDLLYVRLALRVPSRASLSSVNGIIVAQLRPAGDRKTVVPSAELRIVGKPQQTTEVEFEPAEVAIAPIRGCDIPSLDTCRTSADLTLRGDGARGLMVDSREPDATGILHNEAGDTVTARLAGLSEDDNGVITGTVEISGIEHSGKYKGVLALTPGGEGARNVPLTVSVRSSFFWAFLMVLLGAVLAYVMRWREQVGLRRNDLQGRLDVAIGRYEGVRKQTPGAPPASFDLEPELGPPPWGRPLPEPDGIAGLRHRIELAEDQEAFAKLSDEVDDQVTMIGRWVDLERAVRLARNEAQKPVPELQGSSIEDTGCRDDLDRLIQRGESKDILEGCGDYLTRLDRQIKLYRAFRAVWRQKHAILERGGIDDEQRKELDAIDISASTKDLPTLAERQPADLEEAHSRLRKMAAKLERIDRSLTGARPAPDSDAVTDKPKKQSKGWLSGSSDDSRLVAELKRERTGRSRRLQWKKSLAWVNRHDFIWVFVAIAVASIAYAVTLYGDTWGSKVDFFTAFAAGFGVKFGADTVSSLDWTAIPILGPFLSPATERPAGGPGDEPTKPPSAGPSDPTQPSTGDGNGNSARAAAAAKE